MKEAFYDLYGLNQYIFIVINKLTNQGSIEKILKVISGLFDIFNFPIYYVILSIWAYCRLKKLKTSKKYSYYYKVARSFTESAITYILLLGTYTPMKFLINSPRPYCSLPAEQFITSIDVAQQRCLSGFPSSHAALSFMMAFFLWPYLGKYAKSAAVVVAICAAISRITLSMHYPADILYSYLIISVLLVISKKIFRSNSQRLQVLYRLIYNEFLI